MTDQLTADYAGVGTASLSSESSELEGDGPYTIHGIALGAGDITVGSSGVKKLWPGDELRRAAESLEGQPLVVDHENTSEGTVGTVTRAWYDDNIGVRYEAEIAEHYEQYARDVASGILDVSARAYHDPVDQLESDDDTEALRVTGVSFDNLSIVSKGASPSNTANIGSAPTPALSASTPAGTSVATLSYGYERDTDVPSDEEVTENRTHPKSMDVGTDKTPEWEEGDMVRWQVEPDLFGKIVHVDNKKNVAMVEIMGRGSDGMESTGFTITAGFSDIKPMRLPESNDMVSEEDGHMKDEKDDMESGSTDDEESDELDEEIEDEPDKESEELASPSSHTPDWSGLDDSREWSKPSMEDFETDDLSEIDDHFIVSKTGEWPPENFGDLALPVVWPNGDLSLDGLDSAHQMAGQVDGISDDMADDLQSKINGWAEEHFDEPVADEEMESNTPEDADSEDLSDVEDEASTDDDTRDGSSTWGRAAIADLSTTTMTNDIPYTDATEADVESMDDPVVVERDDVESLQDEAGRAEELAGRLDEMNSSLDELSEAQRTLAEVDEDDIEDLKAYDDAVVLTADEHEELTGLVDDVGAVFAEELAEYSPFDAEELQDRWTPLELQEKVEEHEEASIESELGASEEDPDPKGGSVSEEELSETDESVEREEAEQIVRDKIVEDLKDAGMHRQAEKVEDGQISLEEMGAEDTVEALVN